MLKFLYLLTIFSCVQSSYAEDITGIWQSIDDLTGAPKGQIEIVKEAEGSYTGKIIKITPRPGYKPEERCTKCPAPYTNQPILGLNVISGLKYQKDLSYSDGKILDPNSGRIYSLSAKVNNNGQRLSLRGFLGVSAIGRTQVWVRVNP